MATNVFKPYKTTQANLSKIAYKAGQLIFTTDTKRIYIDISNNASGRLLVSADTVIDVDLGADKRTLTFTKADGSTVQHTIVIDIDNILDESSINPIQNSVVATAIAQLQSAIGTNEENIGKNLASIGEINDDLDIEKGKIATAQTDIGLLQTAVSNLQAKDTELGNKDTALQNAINKNAGDIAEHAESLTNLANQDSSLLEKIEQNADDIATNADGISQNADAISTLQGSVSSLQTRDGELQESINANAGLLESHAGSISTLQGNVSSLQSKDTALQTSINNVSDELSSFKTSTGTNFTNVNNSITKIVNGTTVVAKATDAVNAESAAEATKATKDGSGNIITSTYETKTDASQKLTNAQTYAEEKANAALASAKSDAASKVSAHNTSNTSHNDIRLLIEELDTKVTNFLDVDDTTTDQLSEVLTLINNNKGTLESLLEDKVNINDIVDNLTTTTAGKVLSANQGKVLKGLIDTLTNTVSLKAEADDLTSHVNNKSNPHVVTKAQVGLGNVDNTADLDKPVSDAQATAIAAAKKAGTDAQTNLTAHVNDKENPHEVKLSQLGVSASAAELNYVKGVTSAIQTQLNNKADVSDIPTKYAGSASAGGPATSANKLASAQTISLSGDVSGSASFDGSKGIDITVTVSDDSHNHVVGNIDGLSTQLSGITGRLDTAESEIDGSIKGLSVNGTTITYTKNNNTTGTITTKDTTYDEATTTEAGLMSAADKVKVNAMPQIVFCTQAEYAALGSVVQTDGKIYFIR